MAPKRYREGSPNTVLRSMSNTNSEQSGNSMNVNSSQNTSNSRNNPNLHALARQAGRQMAEEEERPAKKPRIIKLQPVTAAVGFQRKQTENFNKLRTKRNSLPRGLFGRFSNTNLQNAVSRGGYENMNAQLNSKLKLANNHERRIKNQLRTLPNGNFRKNVSNKINNVIGNNTKTTTLLKQITNEKIRLNAAKKAAANKATIVNLKQKKKAAAEAKANANARAKANANARAKANANARAKANANARAKANANAKAKANANAAKAAAPANSARVSATTLGSPNQSLNNNASSPLIIKPANKRNSKETAGKLMKEGILLEITKQAQLTARMKNLNNLKKLNTSLNNPNSIKEYDTYAWALLYDMVKGLPDTTFEGMQITPKTLKQIHEKLRQKNAYSSGRTTGGEGNRRIFTETFNNDEIVEFMLLIWLDGSHDEYITSSFLAWLDSPTCKQYFLNRHRDLAKSFVEKFPNPTKYTKTFKKKPAEFKNFKTELFKNITGYDTIRKICIETEAIWFFIHDFNPGTSKQMIDKGFTNGKSPSLSGKFEKELKLGIKEILNTKQTNEIYSGGAINNLKRSGVKIVSLDMESKGDILSEAIRNTPDFRPYVTVANLIDPGKHMIRTSAGYKDAQLVLSVMKTGNVELLNKLKSHYYIGPLNFTIKDKEGGEFFKINLSIRKGGPPITRGGRVSTSDFFDLKVNDKKVLQGATAFEATNGRSKPQAKNFVIKPPEAKMGKFMGDALQYMVVAIQNKYRGRERYFASGDGSACFMYVYFCNKLNIKPKLIIDKGDERIRTVGLRNNNK
jgi:hypothetical protein